MDCYHYCCHTVCHRSFTMGRNRAKRPKRNGDQGSFCSPDNEQSGDSNATGNANGDTDTVESDHCES